MKPFRRQLILAALAAGAATAAVTAQAQPTGDYPNRPIRIIVPFTAGSGSDSSSRFFGDRMSKDLGQSVIVDNKPGANGIIALSYVKSQPADGYTILLASNSPIAVNPWTIKNLPYDSVKDFKPVFGLSRNMNVVIVAPDSRFKTLKDLIAAAHQQPLSMGTYSAGYELAGQWLAEMSGSQFTNVPYKGQAQVMTDVMGGQLDFGLVDLSGAAEMVRGGRMRALAVSGETRNAELPDIPNIRESGYPDYVQYSWVSFYVHADTPDAIVNKLAAVLQKASDTDEAREHVRQKGSQLMPYPPERMKQFHLAEIARFRKIAERAGVKPQ
jgi:tripartite-type tricarboxylate transporter receptor subunit TctC